MANIQIQQLLNKEVSRKEFLSIGVLAVASIFGFGTVVKLLTGKSLSAHPAIREVGYGGSDYGGKKRLSAEGK